MTTNHGGKRNGSGNKPGSKRVAEKRVPISLYIRPTLFHEFKRIHGSLWGRAIEDFMKDHIIKEVFDKGLKQNTRQE